MFDCITMGGTESTRTLSRTRALKRSVMATVPEPAFLEVKLVPITIRYCAKFTFHVCGFVLAAVALNTKLYSVEFEHNTESCCATSMY